MTSTQKMRVAIYVRVSTQDQSCDLQLRELSEYVQARGWIVSGTFEDKASGTNGNRPALKAMLSEARARKIDIILCWKLDRLFRSLKDLVVTLQEFQDLGLAFVSLKDNIDLTTASGRLLMHLLGAFGEFEASLIRERVRAGINNARNKGKRIGRPRMRNDHQIRKLRDSGLSLRKIAKLSGTSLGGVQRAIRSRQS